MKHYHWEIQTINPHTGFWHHTHDHPSDVEMTYLSAADFAQEVADRHRATGNPERRVVVWDTPGVGHLPVVTLGWPDDTPTT